MSRMAVLGLASALAILVAACGGSAKQSAADQELQRKADMFAIDQIEKTWHKASSTHNVDLMMSLWAPDATFTIGTDTYTGTAQIRKFFLQKAASFQPENHWVSETPAFKVRITASGDKGTLYFECVYVDLKTQKVVSDVAADQKIGGKWLIASSASATPVLGP
jgi:ketosteroid isomerase-like protein